LAREHNSSLKIIGFIFEGVDEMARYDTIDNVREYPTGLTDQTAIFMRAVYGWMTIGLGITAVTAWMVASSPAVMRVVLTNAPIFWGVMIVQFALVAVLATRVDRLAPAVASALFLGYSALTGLTMSFVFLAFTGESVARTFLISAGMFGGATLYGMTTNRDLGGFARFLLMGLIGVVLASVVAMFWSSDALQVVTSFIGVIVFAGLAAVDAQRLRAIAASRPSPIAGALALYLDFVNLFLSLLRFFGRRRD
jgi:hypothetical protein